MTSVSGRPWLKRALDDSLCLPVGAGVALLWANLAPASYGRLAHALHFAVNDVGMAFFFALAAKEVVEATSPGGALHTWRRAALPVIAAIGGMAGPALIYLAIAHGSGQPALARGWAIPSATDIAFSYLVARLIFGTHPAVPFLLLLAIADDALGLIILAVFYPAAALHLVGGGALIVAALGAAWGFSRRRVSSFWPYLAMPGSLAWAGLYVGGLHPALALVLVVPFLPRAPRDPGLFVPAPSTARDALSAFEHWWRYPVQGVLLLFGLVNAGVPLAQVGIGTWAVLVAIMAGKPIGILTASGIAVACGLARPGRVSWRDLAVVGAVAGIGFTVALFFATAAFPQGRWMAETKLGALFSVLAGPMAIVTAKLMKVGRFARSRGAATGTEAVR